MALRIFTEPQQGASYDELLAVARLSEELGFDAFFRSDHYLKMGSATGYPGYTDAWTTLAALARDTTTIRLGTLVTPVTFRELGPFAVQATQVDHMSGGRVEVGLGAGWYGAEHDAYGIPFPSLVERYDRLEDQLQLLHGVWRAPDAGRFTMKGRTASFDIEADLLRPVQRPGPPIVLGGRGGPRAARLAASYADEFNVGFVPPEVMKAVHDNIRARCEKVGRDPSTIRYSVALAVCCGENDIELARRAERVGRPLGDLRATALAGTPSEVLETLGRYQAAGADRVYLQLWGLDDVDHLRLIAADVQPHTSL